MQLTERRKMEVNENRGRLGRKNFRRKAVKRGKPPKRHHRKREKGKPGSVIVANPTELVLPGGNNHSSRLARCVWPFASFMGQADTLCIRFSLSAKGTAKKRKII